jgi:hypothetical protein
LSPYLSPCLRARLALEIGPGSGGESRQRNAPSVRAANRHQASGASALVTWRPRREARAWLRGGQRRHSAAVRRGPEHRVPAVLRLPQGVAGMEGRRTERTETARGRAAPVQVPQGHPPGDPVHRQRPVQDPPGRQAAAAQDRGRARPVVPAAAIAAVQRDRDPGLSRPLLRQLRGADPSGCAARGRARRGHRPRPDPFRGAVRRHQDRIPPVPAAGGEQTQAGAAVAVPQAGRQPEPGQRPDQGRPGPRPGG